MPPTDDGPRHGYGRHDVPGEPVYCSAPKRREKKRPTRWKKPREDVFCRGAGAVARTMAGWEGSGWTGTGLDPGGGVGGGGAVRFDGTGAGAAGEGGGMVAAAVAAAPVAAALAAPVVLT